MSKFIEFAAESLIEEADRYGDKSQMIKVLREETDDQLIDRVLLDMDRLEIAFAMKGKALVIVSRRDNARAVVNELKKRL